MEIGASSSCFYPMETEKAFLEIASLGFKLSEIFINADSELEKPFVKELAKIKDENGMEVVSLHGCRSFAEGFDIFSKYKRRFYDSLESYKRYFEAANALGAKFIVLHGTKMKLDIPKEEYAERFFELQREAKSFGVTVAHENVVDFVGAKPDFMVYMKENLGDSFKMVLDIKQARRAGVDPFDFVEKAGESIVHVHLSDYSSDRDCVPPSKEGLFDFKKLFSALKNGGYSGKYIIELYSDSFKDKNEIKRASEYLESILEQA